MRATRLFALSLALLWVTTAAAAAMPATSLWSSRPALAPDARVRTFVPLIRAFRTFSLDAAAMRATLAPAIGTKAAVEIAVPMPDGRLVRMTAIETPLLGPEMQRALPDFRAFAARGVEEPWISARLDISSRGFRAMVMALGGTAYVEPALEGHEDVVMSYWARDGESENGFDCTAQPAAIARTARAAAMPASAVPPAAASPVEPRSARLYVDADTLRTYRYVLTAIAEFTQGAVNGDSLAALSELATAANRIDAIYMRDLSIHFQLVYANAWSNPATDPYQGSSLVVDRNQVVVDSIVGSANYDVAQVFWYVSGGYSGGTAIPGVCWEGVKATSSIAGPGFTSEFYRIMMHEMGHMFGTDHTNDAPCQNYGYPYETYSGSTIMARANRCAPYNVQLYDDHYFHTWTILDIGSYLHSSADCAVKSVTGNHPPVVDAGPNYTIPRGTPFSLTAAASDPDPGDTLTYCWEEFDYIKNSPFNLTYGPLFRSQLPTTSPTRWLPKLATVLANISDTYEALPSVNRLMKFVCTARDNHLGTGGQAVDSMTIAVAGNPFVVTAPNGGESIDPSAGMNVTWTVGGGSVAPTVNLLLSTDGGNTWSPLVSGVPNDGAESATFAIGQTSSTCRIKVEGAGNIFYDVSNANFTLLGSSTGVDPNAGPLVFGLRAPQPNPSSAEAHIGFDLPRAADVSLAVYSLQGQRVRTLASGAQPAGHHDLAWDGRTDDGAATAPGMYYVRLIAGSRIAERSLLRLR